MNDEQAASLRTLVQGRKAGALGTLHAGAPYVSMVPFAILPDASGFVIHVSRLAAHTNDMLADGRVSLLVLSEERADLPAQALPRVTVLGTARPLANDAPEYGAARQAYLDRFPEAAPIFALGDFSLFLIVPEELRWVAGFAQARTVSPAGFRRAMTGA